MQDELLTIQQAADFLRVSTKTLRRWEARGILVPARTVGNQRRYTLEELKQFKLTGKSAVTHEAIGTMLGSLYYMPAPSTENQSSSVNPLASELTHALPHTSEPQEISAQPFQAQSGTHVQDQTATVQDHVQLLNHSAHKKKLLSHSSYTLAALVILAGFFITTTYGPIKKVASLTVGNNTSGISMDQTSVLAAQTKGRDLFGEIEFNIPAIFNEKVTLNNDFIVNGKSLFNEDIKVNNKNVDLGTGKLTASNVLYGITAGANVTISGDPQNPTISVTGSAGVTSIQGTTDAITLGEGDGISINGLEITNSGVLSLGGETGDVELTGGDGIEVSGTTITNTDTGTSQNIFKNILVDADTIIAGSNDDTLTFAAGSGISIVADTGTKTLTITGTLNSQWSTTGNDIYYNTGNVGIGTTTPSSALDVNGNVAISGSTTISSFGVGILHADSAGLLSSSPLNLSGGVNEISGLLPASNGGTGIATTPMSGQLLIGNGSTYDLANLTGTANQVSISNAPGSITFSTPQDIGTASSPTFASLFLPSDTNQIVLGTGLQTTITMETLSANRAISFPDASGIVCLSSGNCGSGGGGGTIVGSGTTNYIVKFTSATGISDSLLYESGGKIGLGTTSPQGLFNVSGAPAGQALAVLNYTGSGQNILVGSASGATRFAFDAAGNLNLASGSYEIGGTSVLNSTTLGAGVVNSSLTAVGALAAGSISSGFGNIDNGADSISGGDITATGANGFTATGNGAGITFSGINNHDIVAGSGTLRLGATTLIGAVTGNGQHVTGLGDLTAAGTITFSGLSTGVVQSNGSGQLSSAALNLAGGSSYVTGTLPVTNGGTGLAAVTTGDLLYASNTNTLARRAIGTSGQVLVISGGLPTWVDSSALSSSYWQRNGGALSPSNITDDLLIGGTATSSAKFQVLAGSGNATTAGTFTFNGGNSIQTTNGQTLTLGGNSTGNITLAPINGSGTVTSTGNLNLASGKQFLINGTSVLSASALGTGVTTSSLTTVGALTSGSIASGFGSITTTNDITGNDIIANGDVRTGAGAGTIRLTDTGSLVNIGTTQLNNITYTWPGSDGSNQYVLTTNGSGGLSWTDVTSVSGLGDITAIGDVTSGAAFTAAGTQGTSLYFYDPDGRGQLTTANLTAARTYTFPDATGTVCLTSGNCAGVGGSISGAGTAGQIAYFNGTGSIESETSGFAWDATNNKLGIGTDSPTGKVTVSGASTGKALVVLNETGNQDILAASASGTVQLVLTRTGDLGIEGQLYDISSNALTVNDGFNLTAGNTYQINSAAVLSATALGNAVTGSQLTQVGVLNQGSIANGFGSIVTANAIEGSSLTANGSGGGLTFTGSGNHDITASGGTLRLGTLTLAGDVIGNSQDITGLDTLSASGTITFGTFTSNGGILYTNASGQLSQVTAGSSTQVLKGGTTPSFGSVVLTTDVSGVLPIANGGTNTGSIGSAGSVPYSNGTSYAFSGVGTSGQVLVSNGSGAPAWTDAAGVGTNYWQRNSGAVAPINITDDFLVGGGSTSSAKFQVFGLSGNASTAGNLTFNSAATIQSTKNQTVTFGGSSTGNIIFSPLNGAGTVSVNGNVNLASGNIYRINGSDVLSATTLGTGVTSSSLTTVGALANGSIANGFGTIFTANTIQGSDITASGTTGFTASGNGAGLTFSGSGTHDITASSGTLRIGPVTLNGALTGNSQNASGFNNFSADGSITFANLGTGVVHSNSSGQLSSGTVNLASSSYVSGLLSSTNGGTGANLSAAAQGSIPYFSGTGVMSALAPGTSGYVLTTNGGGSNPTWTAAAGIGTNYWQRNSGTVAPIDITDDLLIGGASTASAKFQIIGTSGNATSAGNLTFRTASAIQTTANNTLTLGGSTTGNIVLSPNNGSGIVAINGNTNLASGKVFQINGTSVLSDTTLGGGVVNSSLTTVGALASGSIANGFGTIATLNSISGDSLAISGTTVVDSSRNLSNIAGLSTSLTPTAANTYSLGTGTGNQLANLYSQAIYQNGNQVCDSSGNCAGQSINYWDLANGTLATKNATVDLLLGGIATTSAKFAVLNINSGTPTASLSAGAAGGAYLTARGVLGTTANQTLTLGSAGTGNLIFAPGGTTVLAALTNGRIGIGTTTPLATFDVRGNSGTTPIASFSGTTANAGLIVDNNGFGDLFAASKSGAAKFVIKNDGSVGIGTTTPISDLYVQQQNTERAGLIVKAFNGGLVSQPSIQYLRSDNSEAYRFHDEIGQHHFYGGSTFWSTPAVSIKPTENARGLVILSDSTVNQTADLLQVASADESIKYFAVSPLGTAATARITGTTSHAGLLVDNAGTGDIFSASKSGATLFTILNNGNIQINSLSTANCDIKADSTGLLFCGLDGSGGVTNYWDLNANALTPINDTYDVLFGGQSSTSAKFAFLNNSVSGAATASISAGSNNTTYLTGAGVLGTTNKQTLTLGSNSTGNILLSNDTIIGNSSAQRVTFAAEILGGSPFIFQGATDNGFTTTFNISDPTGNRVITLPNNSGTITLNTSGSATAGTSAFVHGGQTWATTAILGTNDANALQLETNDIARLTIGATGSVGIGTTSPLATLDVQGQLGTTPVASFSGQTASAGLIVDNTGLGDLFTASKSGASKFTILNSGNIRINNLANCSALETDATGLVGCGTDDTSVGGTSNYWQLNNGALAPFSTTADLLLGGISTASARFAFTNNIGAGTPTASISANSGNNALYLSGDGTIGTTNKQTLALGSAATGNVLVGGNGLFVSGLSNCDSIDTDSTGKLICGSDAGGGGAAGVVNIQNNGTPVGSSVDTVNFGTDFLVTASPATRANISIADDILDFSEFADSLTLDAATSLALGGSNLTIGTNAGNGGVLVAPNAGGNAALIINKQGSGDIFSASASGTTRLTLSNAGNLNLIGGVYQSGGSSGVNVGTAGCVTSVGGIVTGTAACPNVTANDIWQTGNGTIFQGNVTQDLLIGGIASNAAKFAVLNVNNGTPTASVSAGSTGGAYLSASGTLATTAKQTLTLGDTDTGNIILNTTGFVGIGTGAPKRFLGISSSQTNGLVQIQNTNASGYSSIDFYGTGATVQGTIGFANASAANFTGSLYLNTGSASNPIIFGINDSERMRLDTNGRLGIGTTTTLATLDVRGQAGTLPVASISGQTARAGFLVDNTGLGDLFTASKSGATKFSILNSGNVRINNLNSASCDVKADTTGLLSCGTDNGGINYWQQTNGTVSPYSNTLDVLFGGVATNSAKFAFINNIGSGTPTASISANSGNNATFLSGAGTLGTTNAQTLTLGGTSTGNIVIDSGSGLVSVADALRVTGNLDANSGLDVLGADLTVGGSNATITTAGVITGTTINATTGLQTAGTTRIDNSGNLSNIGTIDSTYLDTTTNVVNFAASTELQFNGTTVINASRQFNNIAGVSTSLTPTAANTYALGTGTGNQYSTIYGQTIYQNGNQVCDTTNNCSSLTYWNQNNGALSTKNATVDLLVGGIASSAAKFAVLNVNSGTPTASLSAGASGGTYVTAAGTLATTARQTLNIGNSTTGNIVLDSGTGNISLADATTISGNVDATNGLDVTGADLTVGGSNASITTAGSITGTNINSTGNILTSGANRIDSSGNLLNIGTIDSTYLDTTTNVVNLAASTVLQFNGTTVINASRQISNIAGVTTSLTPTAANTYALGTGTGNQYSTIYGQTLYQNGNQVCDTSGNCAGTTNYFQLNSGNIAPGNAASSSDRFVLGGGTTTNHQFEVSGKQTGKSLVNLNETGNQNILTASASGTNVLTFDRSGNLSIEGAINDISGNLVLNDTLDLGSVANGINIQTDGTISDNNGNVTINDSTDITGNVDLSGTLTAGTANAFQVAATGAISTVTDESINGIDINAGTVSDVVNLTINAGGTLTIGTTSLNETTSAVDSGASLVGVFDEFANSDSTNVQDVLDDLDNAIGAGSSKWQLNGNVLAPLTAANQVVLGGNTTTNHQFEVNGKQTGKALVNLNETGNQNILTASASGTTVANLDRSGNLAIEGALSDLSGATLTINDDLQVNGDDILDSAGTTRISLGATNTLTGTTFTLSGATTFNGTSLTSINGGATAIDFSEFDVAAGTGSITINDGGDLGNISIEGTILDINSLDFVGAGALTTASGNDLTLNPADEVVFGDTDTFIVGGHAGNVAYNVISDSGGSPTSGQINSDDDLYVEGAIEASALYQGANQVCDTSGNCAGLNYWDQLNGTIRPKNASVDFLVGGTSSSSAKFAVLNVNSGTPTASVSAGTNGAAFLTADGNIQSTAKQSITLGGGNSGNIVLSGFAAGVVQTNASGTLSSGTVSVANGGTGATTFTAGGVVYGNGSSPIAASAQGTAGQALVSGGSGSPTWTTGTLTLAGNFSTSGANALTLTTSGSTNLTLPTTGTLATLAGTETLSSKTLTAPRFADLGLLADSSGNELIIFDSIASAVNEITIANATTTNGPTIAATGGDTNIALSLDSKGSGNLNLNNSATGNIIMGGGSGSTGCTLTNSNGNFACAGTVTGSNLSGTSSGTNTGDQTITLTGDVTGSGTGSFATTIGDDAVDGTDISLTSEAQGNLMYFNGTDWVRLANGTANQLLHSGTTPSWSAVSLTADVSGTLPIGNGGTNSTATPTAGGIAYGDGSAYAFTGQGSAGNCLISNGASAPSWSSCSGGASTNYWQITNGTVSPYSNTLDVLVGGTATNSAKFAFYNVNSGTPTASISAQSGTNSAIVLAADGSIQSVKRQTLTLGGSTTGNINLTPNNGTGGRVNVTGELNLASGNAYQINGTDVLTAGALGAGITSSSLTTVGALNSGSITSGFGAIDVGSDNISGNDITASGTTGFTASGAGAGLTLSGSGTHILQASLGTLQINAFTMGGAITGGGNNITGLGQLTVDNLRLDGNTFDTTSGDMTIAASGGDVIFSSGTVLNVGGNGSDVAFNAFGTNLSGANQSFLTTASDLYIGGRLEVDGFINNIDVRGQSGTTPAASVAAQTSFASLVVNNSGNGDLFTASKSGKTHFTIKNSGAVLIGNATDGITFDVNNPDAKYTGTARPTRQIKLSAEYAGAILTASGSATTNGLMTSDASSSAALSNFQTYYEWSSAQSSLQDYIVAVRVTLPQDFSAWTASNALQIGYNTELGGNGSNKLDVRVYNGDSSLTAAQAGTPVAFFQNQNTSAKTWTNITIDDSDLDDGTAQRLDAAGDTMIIYLKMYSRDNNHVQIGDITLNYLGRN